MEKFLEDKRSIDIKTLERNNKFVFGFKWDGKFKSLRAFKDWLRETYNVRNDLVEMDIRKGGVSHQHGTLISQKINGKWGEQYLGKNSWVVWEITSGEVDFVVLRQKVIDSNFTIIEDIQSSEPSAFELSNIDFNWFKGMIGPKGDAIVTHIMAFPVSNKDLIQTVDYIIEYCNKYYPNGLSRILIPSSGNKEYTRFDGTLLVQQYCMWFPINNDRRYIERSLPWGNVPLGIVDFLKDYDMTLRIVPEHCDRGPANLFCQN